MVNLEWYRSFIEVYRVGTVSGAAQVLHLTQPAVSQHIAALESTLGTQLFQRVPRRMLPTDAGKRLYTQTVAAIETLESIPTKSAMADAPLLIRLGTPPEFFSEYILKCLSLSDTTLFSIRFGLTQELIEQLLEKNLDCVIATQKIPKSELEYQLLVEESFWLVGPPTAIVPVSQDVLQADLTLLEQWLSQQPWIAYSEDLPIIRRFWRVVFGRRLNVNPQFAIPDLRSIRSAISLGLGYSVLPDYLCKEWIAENRLTLVLKPAKAVTNHIWLAYRKSERQSQQTAMLLNLLESASNIYS
ncbi:MULTISPECIES: LysR family transcriptional regulator [Nostocales]|uniref:LysR family transcriptional regulator n=3 Tax=Nostocales TaxID=1161 RepID=A0A0C1R5Z9_9CYAN|nr:LysR family transcriptional regulator [Tolypothrix bouteillei]KAF3888097.1 LysR family transcriptional regulator [Tolypothrix bouteillei VB521301]